MVEENNMLLFNEITSGNLANQNVWRLLGLLAEQANLVVWIRTPDYREQLYLSPAFENIWGRSIASMYEAPLTWNDYLVDDEKNRAAQELCARYPISTNRSRNTTYYRIHHHPSREIRHIRDTCFHLTDNNSNIIAIAGIAECIHEGIFNAEIEALQKNAIKEYPEHQISHIISNLSNKNTTKKNYNDSLPEHYIFLRNGNHVALTKREYDTLKETLLGKSAKEIAKELEISPRTVEIFIEHIKIKLNYQKKSELFKIIHPSYLDILLTKQDN